MVCKTKATGSKAKAETRPTIIKKDPAEEQRDLEALLAKYAGSVT
ncbi:hypothetical protein [Virgibacillus halodenitrificans]|nr:hypothetical protein [Virgibacillus halodenitrificans]